MALSAGCINPPSQAAGRLEEVHQEGVDMDRAFDSLEERLLGGSANLAMWQEMARRHRSVSEVTCQNLDEHVRDIARNLERQQNKAAGFRRRLASATKVGGGLATSSAKLRD